MLRLAALVGLVLFAGCASTNVEPAKGAALAERPADEVRLWARSQEEVDLIETSGMVADAPQTEAYLNGVVRRLCPTPIFEDRFPRVRILSEPTLNAFALPDGTLYVHTGLLVQMANEAQLATILGHEVSHVYQRHSLRSARSTDNTLAAMATFVSATAGAGAILGVFAGAGAISGYSRDLEREADRQGLERLVVAGYNPEESIKAFQILQAETIRSKVKQSFFFGSHPRLNERIESFTTQVTRLPRDRHDGLIEADAYNNAVRPLLLPTARAALSLGDNDLALRCLERFAASGSATAPYVALHAEILRRRNEGKDLEQAAAEVEPYLKLAPDHGPLWRELGLIRYKQGLVNESRPLLREYLRLMPDAPDSAFIKHLIQ